MKIVILMAGRSLRFHKAGFNRPKFLLPVGEKRMIEQVVDNFNPVGDEYVFIINKQDGENFQVKEFLAKLPVRQKIFEIESHNFGPSYSLLQIAGEINPLDEVIVNYCDFLMQWDYQDFLKKIHQGNYDGAVPAFRGFHPASLGSTYYAYLKVNEKNELIELREKQPFTDSRMAEFASTGTYYFKKWQDVCDFGNLQIAQKIQAGSGEYYPSLLYNFMPKAGLKALVYEVKKFICLGTPDDYKQYEYWYDYFVNNQ